MIPSASPFKRLHGGGGGLKWMKEERSIRMPTCTNGAFPGNLLSGKAGEFLLFVIWAKKKRKKKKAGTFNGNQRGSEETFPNVPGLSDWTTFTEPGPPELPARTRRVRPHPEHGGTLNKCRRREQSCCSLQPPREESTRLFCFDGGAMEALLPLVMMAGFHGIPSVLETPFLFSSENTETKQISMIFLLNRFHF